MKIGNVSLMNGCSPLRSNKSKTALKFGNNDFASPFPAGPFSLDSDTFSSTKRTGMFGQDLDNPMDPRNEDDVMSPFYKQRDTFQPLVDDPYQRSLEEQRLMEDAFAASTMMDDTNPFASF